ncbi:MAG TPA: class I SAM-dependent methyltransferase [Blastocatellia bacterium]|nr:class I SAM-dependent methyltransferase [Blastocatellia bacterium]
MGFIGGSLGYHVLKLVNNTGDTGYMDGSAYANKSKLETLFGVDFWSEIKGKVVMDFGCGGGDDAIEMAKRGVRKVIGVEIRENALRVARERAAQHGVADLCKFTTRADELADVIVAVDSFEHFKDPAGILEIMHGALKPDGCVLASFGPTWYHPLGGHLFSVFPWAHLIFTEKALIRWRSDHRSDGATRFHETEGGLNQMTIHRFERIVEQSKFEFAKFEAVPIRKLKRMHNRLTREFTSAILRCKLTARSS